MKETIITIVVSIMLFTLFIWVRIMQEEINSLQKEFANFATKQNTINESQLNIDKSLYELAR